MSVVGGHEKVNSQESGEGEECLFMGSESKMMPSNRDGAGKGN